MEIRVNYQILKAPADVFLAVLNVPISNRRWRVNCQYNCKKTHMAVLKIRSKLEQPESFLGKPRNYMIPYCWLYNYISIMFPWFVGKKYPPFLDIMCLSRLAGLHGQSHSCHSVPHIHINPLPGCVWKWKKKAPELQSEHGNMSYMRGLRCFFFPKVKPPKSSSWRFPKIGDTKKSNLYHTSYHIGYKLDN